MSGWPRHVARVTGTLRANPARAIYAAITATVVLLYLAFLYAAAVEPTSTLTAITANTESLQVTENGDARGQILAAPAWLSTPSETAGACVHGVFTPSAGATLVLTRQGNGDLNARIEPAGGPRAAAGVLVTDGVSRKFAEPVTLTFSASRKGCQAQAILRVPIAGPATLGVDYSAQTDPRDPVLVLLSGRIDTFARAADHFLGFAGGPFQHGLYPTGSANIPAGARVRECAPAAERRDWMGFAEARSGDGPADRNIDVHAFTDARQIALATPGGQKTQGVDCEHAGRAARGGPASVGDREDVLGVSLLSRMVGDPNLAGVSLLLGLFFLVLQLVVAIHAIEENAGSKGPDSSGTGQR